MTYTEIRKGSWVDRVPEKHVPHWEALGWSRVETFTVLVEEMQRRTRKPRTPKTPDTAPAVTVSPAGSPEGISINTDNIPEGEPNHG